MLAEEKVKMVAARGEVRTEQYSNEGTGGAYAKEGVNQIQLIYNGVMLMEIIIFQIYSVDLEEVEDPTVRVVPEEVRLNW